MRWHWLLVFGCLLGGLGLIAPSSQPLRAAEPYDLTAASFLGDSGAEDWVSGGRIQSSGIIVLAANIGSATPGGLTPTLLNGANATTSGAVLRLSPDGKTVLSVTRLAGQVTDLTIDTADNILVAAWDDGLLKLSPEADNLLWHREVGRALRVDAGENGEVSLLLTSAGDPDSSTPGSGTLITYSESGTELGRFDGRHNTLDVCLDAASQTVITIGWRQASVSGTPVQIAYLQGTAYDGSLKWRGYDWSTDSGSPRFINRPTNNMADTRGYRCDVGADGKLYAAFEAAGGNHIFRYSPFDIDTSASIVGGDSWHEFFNSKSEHKTFFARYEPASGVYLRGQQFTARLTSGSANTVRVRHGNITADSLGRVYLGGASAWGLPLPGHPAYTPTAGQTAFLPPGTGDYLGGAWLLVMDANFEQRLYVTRLTPGGSVRALDARILDGSEANILFGGHTSNLNETYTLNPLQPTAGGGEQDGLLAVIAPVTEIQGIVVARISANPTVGLAPLTVQFDASGTTTQNSGISSYSWAFGDGSSGSGETVSHAFGAPGLYTVTLTAVDDQGEDDAAQIQILAAASQIFLPTVRAAP